MLQVFVNVVGSGITVLISPDFFNPFFSRDRSRFHCSLPSIIVANAFSKLLPAIIDRAQWETFPATSWLMNAKRLPTKGEIDGSKAFAILFAAVNRSGSTSCLSFSPHQREKLGRSSCGPTNLSQPMNQPWQLPFSSARSLPAKERRPVDPDFDSFLSSVPEILSSVPPR